MKKAPTFPEVLCAGCDAVLPAGYNGYRQGWVKLPNGDERSICEGRSRHAGSETCRRKAIARAKMCPGCGHEGETEPGYVCGECRKALDTARAFVPKDLAWYVLDARTWIPSTYGQEGWAVQAELGLDAHAHENLINAFVHAIASGQIRERAGSSGDRRSAIVPEGYEHGGYLTELHGPSFEARPSQVEAMRACLGMVSKILREQRLTGRREGRALLAQLAAGKLSPDTWDEEVKKQEAE